MAKVKNEVCEICRKEDCDGKKYQTDHMHGSYGLDVGVKIVCKGDPSVGFHDGKLMYLLTSGHGDFTYFNLSSTKITFFGAYFIASRNLNNI